KDWEPEKTGSYLPLSNEDREKIRTDLAELFTTTFTEVLQKGGYPVVSESGQIMARVYDQRETRNDQFLQLSTSVSNSAEARDAVRTWANILLGRLNAVRVEPTPAP